MWFGLSIVGVLTVISIISYIVDPSGYFDNGNDDFYFKEK